MMTDVLVVGSGGREHALARKLAESIHVGKVMVAPGNAGTALEFENIAISGDDLEALVDYARDHGIGLVVVGPEAPLVAGLSDAMQQVGIPCFGPSAAAARLEGSKVFSKEFMIRHSIPSSRAMTVTTVVDGMAALDTFPELPVLKADGLAGGKGVLLPTTREEAEAGLRAILEEKRFGAAGARVLIEERLLGTEISVHILSDGEHWVLFPSAKDHKAALDGDLGPNTGGMGAYSPSPLFTLEVQERITREVIEPTLAGCRADGFPFRGTLFIGLMMTESGPQVLEYNVRFGDPETQPMLARMRSDLFPLLMGSAQGDLRGAEPEWDPRHCVCLVLTSAGYPGAFEKGFPISGLEDDLPDVAVIHGGTAMQDGQVVTSGGRVLGVVALADDLAGAADLAYRRADRITYQGKTHRNDIGRPTPT